MSIFCLFSLLSCASSENRKLSNHFNGKKFFNPTLDEQFSPGFSDIFKMMREGRPEWPENVENRGKAKLDAELSPNDLSVTFINHATFLIQTSELNILTDPVWSERTSPFSWIGPKRVREPGVTIDELPNIDLILISHNHYDHLDVETLKALNKKFSPTILVPLGDRALVESTGSKDVREMDWWETIDISPDTQITFTPTQHSSARGLFDRDKSLWGSFFVKHANRSMYFGGDAGYSTHFSETKKRLGNPDIALLGIGAYAPRFFMKKIHMDPADAVQAHKDLGAKVSIGMHYGTFQLASEGFDEPVNELKKEAEKAGVLPEAFTTLLEGETRIFNDSTIN